jgi:hypothetical protein
MKSKPDREEKTPKEQVIEEAMKTDSVKPSPIVCL